MAMTPKIKSILLALKTIEPAKLEQLCADLLPAGALRAEWKDKPIWMPGSSLEKNATLPYPVDGIIEMPEGLWVLQCSRQEKWVSKIKADVESVNQWAEKQSRPLLGMIFITTRDIKKPKTVRCGVMKLLPAEYVKKELSPHNSQIQAFVFGQEDLLRVLRNRKFFDIRKEWLNIPEDYFLSLKSFKSYHFNQARDRHIYLKSFVSGPVIQERIKMLEDFVSRTDKKVLLIHGRAGIGKTRFVLESLRGVKKQVKNVDILFNQRKTRANVDEIITEIPEDRNSLIVLDDAHLIDNLTDFAKILLHRKRAKMILIVRPTAREAVVQAIGNPTDQIELTPLDTDASIELLKSNLKSALVDESLKCAAEICDGNPLLIGIIAHLINNTEVESLADVKKHDLVGNYLKTVLVELRQSNQVSLYRYEPYLALLFLLKPFKISDTQKRALKRSLVIIDEVEEGLILRDLENCDIIERHGDTLWLYPDLLGDYLVEEIFFSEIPILNFDSVFSRIPQSNYQSVFKTLRELHNRKADMFLRQWCYELKNKVEFQNTSELCDSLELLAIVAPTVADEAFQIIDDLIRPESEKPPSESDNQGLDATRKYSDVLFQCLRILGNHGLRYDHFDATLENVSRIYNFKPECEEYAELRKEALEAITETASFNLYVWTRYRNISVQERMLEKVLQWKQENVEKNFEIILGVCGKLLHTQMKSEYSDHEGFSWTTAPVEITDELICLRRDVISLLQSIYDELQVAEQQIEIARVLNCGTEYPAQSKYSDGMREMIESNIKIIYEFYLTLATSSSPPEAEVLEEIEQQAHYLKEWRYEDMEVNEVLDRLLSAIQDDEWYQLYRTLLSGIPLLCKNEDESFEQVEADIKQRITEMVDGLSDEDLSEWFDRLNAIAEIAERKANQGTVPFHEFLVRIGQTKPRIAQALIDRSLCDNNALKGFVSEFIKGIRASTQPDIARNYVDLWLSGEDEMLILEIPESYRNVDEQLLDEKDVEIYASLLNCKMEENKLARMLGLRIMSNIRWVYKKNASRATEIICQLFREVDQECVLITAHELRRAIDQIDLSQWHPKYFKEILKRFEDLPTLNSDAIFILARYAEREPMLLIQFFARRVEKQMERGNLSEYRAIPFRAVLKELAVVYQVSPQYSEALNQILLWFQKDDIRYKYAAANLISGISPELDGPLKQTLVDMIKSGDEKNVGIALMVLEEYPEDDALEALCKDAVKYSRGKRKLQDRVEVFLLYNLRGRSTNRVGRKLHSWRDDENVHVSGFAKRVIKNRQSQIENERRWNAEDEMKRRKGVL